jgi:hypothetical protein
MFSNSRNKTLYLFSLILLCISIVSLLFPRLKEGSYGKNKMRLFVCLFVCVCMPGQRLNLLLIFASQVIETLTNQIAGPSYSCIAYDNKDRKEYPSRTFFPALGKH